MTDSLSASEDLKAFERRLTEILACYQPQTKRWRIILLILALTTLITAFRWLADPITEKVSLIESLHNHTLFTLNCFVLISLFMMGVHKKAVAPAIIVSRIKSVLENFNMSCDQNGRLILKRSSSTHGTTTANNTSSFGKDGIHSWLVDDQSRPQFGVHRASFHSE